jgi:hypothetical protein
LRKAKEGLFALIIVLIIGLLPLTFVHPLAMVMPTTTVAVDPTETTVKVGQTFPINVNISDVSGLVGFDFMLSYNKAIIKLTDIELGPFLKSVGSTFLINLTTSGQVWLAACLYEPQGWTGISANGSGVLATATFQALAVGESLLDLFSDNPCKPCGIKLAADPQDPPVVAIPNVAIDGHVVVLPDPNPSDPPLGISDIIAQAAPSKTVVGQGYNISISVTTTNRGDIPEALSVASYANATKIEERTMALSNGSSTTMTFVWDTTGYAYGNYTISAYISPVLGGMNISNNKFTGGWVVVSLVGDVRGPNGWPDGKVEMRDIGYVARRFGATSSSLLWDPNADINGDGVVDMRDIGIVALNFKRG